MKQSGQTRWACWYVDAAGVLFCAVVTLSVYYAGLRPLIHRRAAMTGLRNELATERRKASHLVACTVTGEKELLSVRRALDESRITLEPVGHVNRRIAKLTELLNECGLKVDSIQLEKTYKASKCDIVPISLVGLGGYKRCAAFLHRLSAAFPDTSVASLEISGDPQEPDKIGKFHFGLSWYAARETEPPQQ